jgi:hypothetical protein
LGGARRTAARLSAFARKLARRDPDEALFHLLLCQAFAQEAKNAWKVEDYTAIKEALRKATEEARTAVRLDPQSIDARQMLASLQEKLVGVPSGPPSSR